jgi:glutathione S-transferase
LVADVPSQLRNQRQKLRRQEAQEFDRVCGPVPEYLVRSDADRMNADLTAGIAQEFGQRSDKANFNTKRFDRNKKNHDDALARLDQFIERLREYLADDSWTSTDLARKIKRENPDERRKVETIKNFVQKARKRMRANPIPALSLS